MIHTLERTVFSFSNALTLIFYKPVVCSSTLGDPAGCIKVTLSVWLEQTYTLRLTHRIAKPREVPLSVTQFSRPSRSQSQNYLMNQLATSGGICCSQSEYLDDRLIWRAQTCLLGIKKNPESEPRGCMIIALFAQGHSNPPCSLCDFHFNSTRMWFLMYIVFLQQ